MLESGDLIIFLVFALVAEILGTIGGFGSSLLFVPLASFFFDFQSVLAITGFFHLSSNVSKLALFRKGINKNVVLWVGLPAVVFSILGSVLSQFFNAIFLEGALAFFLLSFSLFFLLSPSFKLIVNRKSAFLGGSASGLAAGLVGTGGAIRGLTLAAFNLPKDAFIATSAFIDLGVDLGRSSVYFFNGYFKNEHIIIVLQLVVIGFVGSYIGKWVLQFVSERVFKIIVLVLVLSTGLYLMAKPFL